MTMIMRGLVALCALILVGPVMVGVGVARADSPPFETSDTDIVDRWEISSFITAARGHGLGYDVYGTDLAVPLAPRWEITLTPTYVVRSEAAARTSGWGDTEVAVKFLAQPESATRPAIALEPLLILPTGNRSRRLGGGVVRFELPVLVSKHIGRWRLSGRLGYARAGPEDFAPASLLAERSFGEKWMFGAEVAFDAPLRRPADLEAQVNFGCAWRLSDSFELAAVVGRRFAGPDGQLDSHSRLMLRTEF